MGQHEVTRRGVEDKGGGVAVVKYRTHVVGAEVVTSHIHYLSSRRESVHSARAIHVGDDWCAVGQRGDERRGVLVAHMDGEEEVVTHALHGLTLDGRVRHCDLAVRQLLLPLVVLHVHVQDLCTRTKVRAVEKKDVSSLAAERTIDKVIDRVIDRVIDWVIDWVIDGDGGDGGSGEGARGELAAPAVETHLPDHGGTEATADRATDAVLEIVRTATQHLRRFVDQRGGGSDGVSVGDGVVERT